MIKIQLGAQIDGFGTIVCNTIIVPCTDKGRDAVVTGREADLLLATYYANELLLRLMLPPGLLATGSEDEKRRATTEKALTQNKISTLLDRVAKTYDCRVVQNTTCWMFERNDIESKNKIILSPTEGMKGEGMPGVGEVWGVEVGLSLGSGKVKDLEKRSTLHRRTAVTYGLKRPSSRQILSEVVRKFGTFPFSLRQLDDERAGKIGVVECVRSNVLREYKPAAEADGSPVSRLLTTIGKLATPFFNKLPRKQSLRPSPSYVTLELTKRIAITKNGITRLAAPPPPDLSKLKSEHKITDNEILQILERPLAKSTGAKSKNKKKKKKPAKKAATDEEEDEEEEESSDED